MERAFTLAPYHLHIQALPFWVAAAVMLAMFSYAALARKAPTLRYSFMGICLSILPFVVGTALASSTHDMEIALFHARVGAALTPLAGAFVLMFDVALARRLAHYRRWLIVAFALALVYAVVGSVTDWATRDIWITPSDAPYAISGPIGWMSVALAGVFVLVGSLELWRRLGEEPSPHRRRQYRGAIWAFSIAVFGSVDLLLSYRIGYGPVSWFFLTVGSLIALRSLATDELVGAVAFDRRAAEGLAFFVVVGVSVWWLADVDGPTVVFGVVAVFVTLRGAAAVTDFLLAKDVVVDSPLERAFDRYNRRLREVSSVEQIGAVTSELLELALGAERSAFLVPSEGDYSWRAASGDALIEDATPDPRLLSWFVDHARPVARDDIVAARLGELRGPMEWLFDVHGAEIIVPLVSRDDLVGLVVVHELTGGRSARPDELALLARVGEQASSAVVYAAMFREANARVEVDKEVELAAAVQDAFIPGSKARRHGGTTVTGRYAPASRCGGDWWSAHELTRERSLILVGDVTGHGVAAAMVTAAAKGCCDVALRLMGEDVDLRELMRLLHRAVLRTGGDEFYMTCFATVIDRGRGIVQFANAGHVVPYLARRENGRRKLDVLVARGNPLGALGDASYQVHERQLAAGDVLVWYTDGIVECTNREGQQLGDRRFQRMLRRMLIDGEPQADLDALCDRITREAELFRDGHPPADDITLVVGRVGDESTVEPAR